MTKNRTSRWTALFAACLLAGAAAPAFAQDSTVQEIRIRQLEAQVRELLRTSGAARTVAPQNGPVETVGAPAGAPSSSPVTDLLTRMDALEASVARLTAQNEELSNRLRQIQAGTPASTPAATPAPAPAAPTPAPLVPAPAPAKPVPVAAPAVSQPAPTPAPAKPSAQRVAAVKAIVKPQTNDAGDDEYSYGFRLYQAKFYPEAAQQLKLFVDKYPRHARTSQGRNLLGRALLDDGKAREAAPWFLQNYKTDPTGNRAADSLLNLADAMRQIGDTTRACIALNEFSTNYAGDAKGRLRGEYDKLKGAVTCS
ncbi:MAG: hypothetical protein KGN34_10900 [Sphingomonadales bacterium]|nr:hypothetical protein [Sphingomonadales bacterium]